MQRNRFNNKSDKEVADGLPVIARSHWVAAATTVNFLQYFFSDDFKEKIVFHENMSRHLHALSRCLTQHSRSLCYPAIDWDDKLKNIDSFKKFFLGLEKENAGRSVSKSLGEVAEIEHNFYIELLELEQWMTRPVIQSFDSKIVCPANVEVADVFYDCPVGAGPVSMLRQASASASLQQVLGDAAAWCLEAASGHLKLEKAITDRYLEPMWEFRWNLIEYHSNLSEKLLKLSACLADYRDHYRAEMCKEDVFPNIGAHIQQISCYRTKLNCVYNQYLYSSFRDIVDGWVDDEKKLEGQFSELAEWFKGMEEYYQRQLLLKPEALSRDTGTICTVPSLDFKCAAEQQNVTQSLPPIDLTTTCPANTDVDEIFYDCPTGADVIDPDAPATSQPSMTQTITTCFMSGAKATFIIDMVGYLSKQIGCNNEEVSSVRTATWVAISLYSGSYLGTLAYYGAKDLALRSGYSETNASRIALAAQTGITVMRNFTVPGLVGTGVGVASSYAGSFAGSFASLFTQMGAETLIKYARERQAMNAKPAPGPSLSRC